MRSQRRHPFLNVSGGLMGLLCVSLASQPQPTLAEPAVRQPPQQLPLESRWCLPKGDCILLEVADEPREQTLGLQLRSRLAPLRGMWFPYAEPQMLRFWMYRTPQPLDMVFLRNQRVIAIETNTVPCPHLPCRSYGPREASDGVVELAAGEAARLGILVGTPAAIAPIERRP
jgi:uncharacterized membrane protein (UPF0127 family)